MGNIEAALQRRFGKFKRSQGKHGIEYIVRCPLCGKRDKMYINPDRETYICFRGCGSGTLQQLLGTSEKFDKVWVETVRTQPRDITAPGIMQDLRNLPDDCPAITYLKRRKYDPAELNNDYGVRYCSEGRVFGHIFNTTSTLIFPLWMSNKVVGWQSRLLYDPDKLLPDELAAMGCPRDDDGDYMRPPKYFTSPGLEKSKALFNFDNARQSDVVIITEGPFDAIGAGRCAVATLGKGVTEQQANLVKSYWRLAVIMLDPGDADRESAYLETLLAGSIEVLPMQLKGYKDPGEAPRMEIWRQIAEAAHARGLNLNKYRITV